jgi:Trk K+ transport system NAD-binding subunit
VEAGTELAGKPVHAAERPGETHVLAVRRRGTDLFDWSLTRNYQLKPQDRLLVLATRAGLGETLARNKQAAPLTV